MKPIYLSPPDVGPQEWALVEDAFASNWIAPLGPHVDAFEKEFAEYIGVKTAAAVSSGTAAMHLAMRLVGVGPGDEVLCSTFTFCASAFPILYEGARPVFIDSDRSSWNMDSHLLREEIRERAACGRLPRAVVVVDIYGQCADYDPILEVCSEYEIPVIEDAAQALGATYKGRMAGSLGTLGVFSFNGNKIITTSGGGMLVGHDEEIIQRARFLASQARDPAPHYEHSTIGYNYRMSNLLAALGRGQMRTLDQRVAARRRQFEQYQQALEDLSGLEFMPEADYGRCTRWLTCITIDAAKSGATRDVICQALKDQNIESRPVWKPLHLQPVFAGCRARDTGVAVDLFHRGLCLPSGTNLTDDERMRVIEVVSQQISKPDPDRAASLGGDRLRLGPVSGRT